MSGRTPYKASRGRGVRRVIIPHVLTPNPPVAPVQAPLSSQLPVEMPIEPQAPDVNEFNAFEDLSIQQRGPRGAYLAKNIPKDASERQLIHIIDQHYLESIATGMITKDFKSYFRGKQTQWQLIDPELKDQLYQSFQDRFQHKETVDLKTAKKVWEARSKARCRGTWALVRETCKSESNSTNPSDWKEYCPEFVNSEDWDGILDSWKTDKWQRRSIAGAKNRKSVPGDVEGTSSYVRHTGGSISFGAHCHRLEQVLGKKPSEIMMFEKMHKTHKGNGDWCDARSEQVATKYDEVVHVDDDDDLESDLPFDTDAWVKVVGVPKKDDVYGFGRTQVAKRIRICASSSNKKKSTSYDSTPVDNEVTIESQVDARVESRLESIREEMREERRVEMEQLLKSINDQRNKSS